MFRFITIASLMLVALACSAQEKKTGKFGSFLKKVSTAVTTVSKDTVTNENSDVSQERLNEKFNASSTEYLEKSKEARNSYDNLSKRTIKSAVLDPNEKKSSSEAKPKETPKPTIDIDSTLTEYDRVLKLYVECIKKLKAAAKAFDQAQMQEASDQLKKTDEIKTQLKKDIDSNVKAMTAEQKARLDSIEDEYVKSRDAAYGN